MKHIFEKFWKDNDDESPSNANSKANGLLIAMQMELEGLANDSIDSEDDSSINGEISDTGDELVGISVRDNKIGYSTEQKSMLDIKSPQKLPYCGPIMQVQP